MAAEETRTGRKRTIDRIRERKERHKQRHKLYRIAVGLAGGTLVVAGLLLSLPGVPGPGLVIVAIGLGLLALEFDRAERLLERILDRLERVSDTAKPWQKVVLGVAAAVGLAAAIAAVFLIDVPVIPGSVHPSDGLAFLATPRSARNAFRQRRPDYCWRGR